MASGTRQLAGESRVTFDTGTLTRNTVDIV